MGDIHIIDSLANVPVLVVSGGLLLVFEDVVILEEEVVGTTVLEECVVVLVFAFKLVVSLVSALDVPVITLVVDLTSSVVALVVVL